jgi:uncharacterized protein (TIRG00374 family)
VVAFVLGWQTVPTAGVGGLVLWSLGLSRLGVPREGAVASGILYAVLDYVALFVLLAVGMLVLLLERSLPPAMLVPLVLMSLAILAAAATVAGLLSREERGIAIIKRMVSAANGMLVSLGRISLDAARISATASQFYADWRTMGVRWRHLLVPAWWVLAARVLDVLTLQVLFAAAGHPMPWGALAVGFVYANFASAVSVLPTGLGVLDASLAILFAGLGAPLPVAVVVTLLFRFLAYWLPIPYGLYVYQRITREHAADALPQKGVAEGT